MMLQLCFLIFFFFCAFYSHESEGTQPKDELEIQDVIYEKVLDLTPEVKLYQIRSIDMGFTSKRGIVGKPIISESGERLELVWKGLIPRYELFYFKGEDDAESRVIGSCHFRGGCNECRIVALDLNGNDIPDQFLKIEWISRDGCGKHSQKSKNEIVYIYYPRFEALFICNNGICLISEKDSSKNEGSFLLPLP